MKKTRTSKIAQFTSGVVRDHIDLSSLDVIRKRQMLAIEERSLDEMIAEATARLIDAKDRRAKVSATLDGLAVVLERR